MIVGKPRLKITSIPSMWVGEDQIAVWTCTGTVLDKEVVALSSTLWDAYAKWLDRKRHCERIKIRGPRQLKTPSHA